MPDDRCLAVHDLALQLSSGTVWQVLAAQAQEATTTVQHGSFDQSLEAALDLISNGVLVPGTDCASIKNIYLPTILLQLADSFLRQLQMPYKIHNARQLFVDRVRTRMGPAVFDLKKREQY